MKPLRLGKAIALILLMVPLWAGCSKSAADMYKAEIKKHPNSPKAHIDYAYYLETEGKKYEEAIKEYDAALKLRPGDYLAANNKAHLLFELGNYGEAVKIFLQLAKKNPNRSDVYSNVAMCYHKMKRYDYAYQFYSRALELNPTNKPAVDGMNILKQDIEELQKTAPAVKGSKAPPQPAPGKTPEPAKTK